MMIFIIAIVAIGLMMLGLSITLMRKGRNIQGDVGDNDNMKALGLECALKGEKGAGCNSNECQNSDNQGDNCSTCRDTTQCIK